MSGSSLVVAGSLPGHRQSGNVGCICSRGLEPEPEPTEGQVRTWAAWQGPSPQWPPPQCMLRRQGTPVPRRPRSLRHFLPAALPDWVRLGQTGPDWAWLACWGLGLPIPSQAPPCPGHLTRPDPPRGTSAAHSLAPQPCRLSAPPPRVLGPPSCPGSPDPPHSSRTLLVGSHMPEFGRVPRSGAPAAPTDHGDQSLEGGSEPPAHLVTRPLHSCRVSHKHRR